MSHLKGGRYLIDLGVVSSGDDISAQMPKDFLNFLWENSKPSNGVFNSDIITKLKSPELTFTISNNGRTYKLTPTLILADDYTELKMTSSINDLGNGILEEIVIVTFVTEDGLECDFSRYSREL